MIDSIFLSHATTKSQHMKFIQCLFDNHKSNIDIHHKMLSATGKRHITPLQLAIMYGFTDIVPFMLHEHEKLTR